ncbi:MAG: DUF1919 domain-containing protein [Granulosicoccaceae bacterium]
MLSKLLTKTTQKATKLARKAQVQQHIRGIKSRDFSIIASNCTGTLPYRFIDMTYLSPTANLFFYAPCYLKFAARLDYYLKQELKFVGSSKYVPGRIVHQQFGQYPIAHLDDVEIHFMHYETAYDAQDKWIRRSQRINPKKIIFAFTDRDLCTLDLMQQFDLLPGRKILLTAQASPWLSSAITVPAYRGQSEIGDAYTNYNHLSHVNFRRLIDGPAVTQSFELADLEREENQLAVRPS